MYFVLTILVFCGLSAAGSHHKYHRRDERDREVQPLMEERTELCVYNNVTYGAGEKFKPDPCTHCHCPRRGGKARCSIIDCKYDPGCVAFESKSDECCGTCLERGCLHTDGKVYAKGTEVRSEPCTKCFCPKDSERTVCMKTQCPTDMCVDPVWLPHKCCSYCPRGPNCNYQGNILSASEVVRVDRCTICHCPNPIKSRSLDAVCRDVCKIKQTFFKKQLDRKKGRILTQKGTKL